MSDPNVTVHLGLPFLSAAQAQKHVTHNEALRRLDLLVQMAVRDAALASPPAAPEEGARYIVAADGAEAWAGHDGEIAAFVDGAWSFHPPAAGWLAYDEATAALLVHDGAAWSPAGAAGNLEMLGINATADAVSRLAVRSEAVLFAGLEAADGGTGDIRFVVSKEGVPDTATLLFQSAYVGRAEMGLAGDDDFVLKVSADGDVWTEAIRIPHATGLPAIRYDNAGSGLSAETVQDALDELAATGGGGGGGAVSSVFGRSGAVAAEPGDYGAADIGFDDGASTLGASDVQAALAALAERALPGAISGLALANSTGDSANDIVVATGTCASSSASPILMQRTAPLTKRLDAAWTAGGGSGGRLDATVTDGTWHVFLLRSADGTVVDAGMSQAVDPAGAAYFPAGAAYRRIGSVLRVGGTIVPFSQAGDEFLLRTPVAVVNQIDPGTAAVLLALPNCPVGIKVRALLSFTLTNAAGGGSEVNCVVTSPDQADVAPDGFIHDIRLRPNASTSANPTHKQIRTDMSGRVRYRLDTSSSNFGLRGTLFGWFDTRGRDE